MDTHSKLEERCLPPKEAFFDKLRQAPISDDQYQYALLIWEKLGFSEMREFCEFYLSLDILLLAGLARYDSIVEKIHNFYHFHIDIMTNFRSLSLLEDKLDPLYYLTLPG